MLDLQDFTHAAGFYAASVVMTFLAAMAEGCWSSSEAFLALFSFVYAAIVCMMFALGFFALGTANVAVGVKKLRRVR